MIFELLSILGTVLFAALVLGAVLTLIGEKNRRDEEAFRRANAPGAAHDLEDAG